MPDGMVRWIGCRGMAVYEDGIPVRTLGLIWDDSPRKQQEAVLSAAPSRCAARRARPLPMHFMHHA